MKEHKLTFRAKVTNFIQFVWREDLITWSRAEATIRQVAVLICYGGSPKSVVCDFSSCLPSRHRCPRESLESALPQATNEVGVSSIQYYVPLTWRLQMSRPICNLLGSSLSQTLVNLSSATTTSNATAAPTSSASTNPQVGTVFDILNSWIVT